MSVHGIARLYFCPGSQKNRNLRINAEWTFRNAAISGDEVTSWVTRVIFDASF
jgi:hypothetical protein